jgi:hypothetical protein
VLCSFALIRLALPPPAFCQLTRSAANRAPSLTLTAEPFHYRARDYFTNSDKDKSQQRQGKKYTMQRNPQNHPCQPTGGQFFNLRLVF